MWTHLSDADVIDVMEGAGGGGARAHAAGCAGCRARLEEARSGLAAAGTTEVPEPSPLFWEALQRNVERTLAADPRPAPRHGWVAAAMAAATVVVAIAVLPTRTAIAPPGAPAPLAAWSALPPSSDDAGLEAVAQVAPAVAEATSPAECRDWAECVATLSDDESRELASALKDEMGGGKPL